MAKENYILRSLLREHGVTDREIEDSIRSKLFTSDVLLYDQSRLKVKQPLSQHLLPESTRVCKLSSPRFVHGPPSTLLAQEDAHITTPITLSDQVFPADPVPISQAPSHGLSDSCPRWPNMLSITPLCTDVAPQPIEAQELDSHDRSADDTTSCEIAASIIASMRGHVDAEEARAELGCSSNLSCMIKNTTIFQRMDQ